MEIVQDKIFQIEASPPYEFSLVEFFYLIKNELKEEYDIFFTKGRELLLIPHDRNFHTPFKIKCEIENKDVFLIHFKTWEDGESFLDDIEKIFKRLDYVLKNLTITDLSK